MTAIFATLEVHVYRSTYGVLLQYDVTVVLRYNVATYNESAGIVPNKRALATSIIALNTTQMVLCVIHS
jgi:hypothetical protein